MSEIVLYLQGSKLVCHSFMRLVKNTKLLGQRQYPLAHTEMTDFFSFYLMSSCCCSRNFFPSLITFNFMSPPDSSGCSSLVHKCFQSFTILILLKKIALLCICCMLLFLNVIFFALLLCAQFDFCHEISTVT